MSQTRDKKFKRLEQTWYDKLKSEGFVDIENTKDRDRRLREWDFNFFRNKFVAVKYETTLAYYNQGRQILTTYSFKTEMHKRIWELHIEGRSERQIAVTLDGAYKKSMVHYIIAEIAKMIKKG